jgi:hypothetical protein
MSGSTTFQRNHRALARVDSAMAERLAATEPADLHWHKARTGAWTATLAGEDGRSLSLASRYDPAKEAKRLIEAVDFDQTACLVLMGFGLGYHIAHASETMGRTGMIVVYEPDTALLRAVLEQIDYSHVLGTDRTLLADSEWTRAQLTQRLEKHGALLTQGTQLLEHPPSRQRHREAFREFSGLIKDVIAYCRTNVATALVNATRTCWNLANNLDHYIAGHTTGPLADAAAGYPAVCVSAGPSLVKNVHWLADPAVRENVVVIAVQTALKPLLDRGVRPDFVTALDYARISKRFYEDLPPLPEVTLVAEPKAHPTILDNFPGPVRITRSEFNDTLAGELARPFKKMQQGATVAHLSFYLAQYLGCDPIMFIGQDLGFSDGLYYCPGTAVHRVWSSELNPLNTVEMMEWRRIMRMRGNLERCEDIHGRTIFSDEQMLTYLKQFERDFAAAPQTIIDATEGGTPKEGTTTMPLAEALAQYAHQPVPTLPTPSMELDTDRLSQLADLLQTRIDEVHELRRTSQRSIPILRQMKKHQGRSTKMNKLFARLNKNQHYVHNDLKRTFDAVNAINQLGAYRRSRADRSIHRITDDAYHRQAQQLDRDIENLDWLTQACDEALDIFHAAQQRVTARLNGDEASPQQRPALAAGARS